MKKGSITVEAAMGLPIFMFFFLGISYLICIISLQYSIQTALSNTANQMSLGGYFDADKKSNLVIQMAFNLNLEKEYLGKNCISGGIVSLGESYYEGNDLTLVANYKIKIPAPIWNTLPFHITQIARTRLFVGRDKRKENENSNEDKDIRYVFITDTGKVYHESENCSHLRRVIETVEKDALSKKRNEAGGKYYPCELCLKKKKGQVFTTFYITADGDRYHCSKECSGLKRTIKKVPYESVKTWRACKRCG
ncbi:MAG: TadE/TadG family type IV pilus assembly protein [Velocimicrobium sp.]